jgi:EAL domain-containing protein (putative c-di-GMP-specific phosphodiesterase class I)
VIATIHQARCIRETAVNMLQGYRFGTNERWDYGVFTKL